MVGSLNGDEQKPNTHKFFSSPLQTWHKKAMASVKPLALGCRIQDPLPSKEIQVGRIQYSNWSPKTTDLWIIDQNHILTLSENVNSDGP